MTRTWTNVLRAAALALVAGTAPGGAAAAGAPETVAFTPEPRVLDSEPRAFELEPRAFRPGDAPRLPPGTSQESEAAAARITLAEFKRLFDQNAVIVLDVRNDEAYKAGHFPGAILVPLETVSSRAAEWKGARKPIVTYCS